MDNVKRELHNAIDFDSVKNQVAATLIENLHGIVEGAADDVRQYAHKIGSLMVKAAASGNEDLLAEVKGQAIQLAEIQRLRAVHAGWNILGGIVDVGTRFAGSLLDQASTAWLGSARAAVNARLLGDQDREDGDDPDAGDGDQGDQDTDTDNGDGKEGTKDGE